MAGTAGTHEFWTCPHCFATIKWSQPDQIAAHNCEAIRQIVTRVQSNTADRLDTVVQILKNPNPKPRRKKHGT